MGEVWEATDPALGSNVAIKVMNRTALASDEMRGRFAREAFLLARVQSEHVVSLIDFVPLSPHGPVLVMELVEGPTLADRLTWEPLHIGPAVDIAVDVLRGLVAMHACQVIHRDVKPANIILRRVGGRAVLIDLGVGRLAQTPDKDGSYDLAVDASDEITTHDRVVGTFEYMAPEQIVHCHTADACVDVYAVGAVLYRAVAGCHPFGDSYGDDLLRMKMRQPIPRLRTRGRLNSSKKFEAILHHALAFEADDRFKSASELLEALESLQTEMQAAGTGSARRSA